MNHRRLLKKVLIAHQSTIPHYRVPFYNALETLRPAWWCFDVVFDSGEIKKKRFFRDALDPNSFKFPTLEVKTFAVKFGSRTYSYQTFWSRAAGYDLVVVEDALNNLTYPLCQFHQLRGTRLARWGLGAERGIEKFPLNKRLIEKLKMMLTTKADGYFAYTEGLRAFFEACGLPPDKIFIVNNTIDINKHRDAFEKFQPKKEVIRKKFGLSEKKVLLFVSSFKTPKRVDFLLEAFSIIQQKNENFHLLLVGSGGEAYLNNNKGNITYFGSIVDLEELAPIYVASDIFTYPGQIGLAPLQALCYDLPVIAINSSYLHGPEVEYLLPTNSIMLDDSTTPEEYALTVINFVDDSDRLRKLKASIWPSINHLTVEQMAKNFISGVNILLTSQ